MASAECRLSIQKGSIGQTTPSRHSYHFGMSYFYAEPPPHLIDRVLVMAGSVVNNVSDQFFFLPLGHG